MFSNLIIIYSQVSVSKARAIIVLASDENADQVIYLIHYSFVNCYCCLTLPEKLLMVNVFLKSLSPE